MKDYVVLKMHWNSEREECDIDYDWQFDDEEEAMSFAESLLLEVNECVEVQEYDEVTETFETILFIKGGNK